MFCPAIQAGKSSAVAAISNIFLFIFLNFQIYNSCCSCVVSGTWINYSNVADYLLPPDDELRPDDDEEEEDEEEDTELVLPPEYEDPEPELLLPPEEYDEPLLLLLLLLPEYDDPLLLLPDEYEDPLLLREGAEYCTWDDDDLEGV